MESASTFLKNRRTGDSNSAALVIPHFSDDGSFFDLPDVIPEQEEFEEEDELSDNEKELNFDNDGEKKNVKLKLSPSEDEILLEDESSKFLVSLVKSASKFRFLLLNLKRSKSVNGSVEKSEDADEEDEEEEEEEKEKGIQEKQGKSSSKFLSVKFKIDDVKLPLVSSLFTSSKEVKGDSSSSNLECNSGKLSKEMVHKYLKMVKPLYFLVSKNNYMGKLKLSGGSGAVEKKGLRSSNNNLVKLVRNNLGKLQSDVTVVTGRHDDSMLEVQDGIQGAILHCKKSFQASKSTGMESSSILCPLMQDTCETPPPVKLGLNSIYY